MFPSLWEIYIALSRYYTTAASNYTGPVPHVDPQDYETHYDPDLVDHTYTLTHWHTHTLTHTCTHTLTHTHTHTYTHIHTHTHTQHTHTVWHTYSHTHTHWILTHSHTHTQHTHWVTHTHTYTHRNSIHSLSHKPSSYWAVTFNCIRSSSLKWIHSLET